MYNPDGIQLDYQTRYQQDESINRASQSSRYMLSQPTGLSLTLLFDATMPGNNIPVETQLATLKALCTVDASTSVPHFLKIKWGKMRWENKGYFACGQVISPSITPYLIGTPPRCEPASLYR